MTKTLHGFDSLILCAYSLAPLHCVPAVGPDLEVYGLSCYS